MIFGDHSLNQIVFGWLLGIWISLSHFFILRDRVHAHIEDLTSYRMNSNPKIYYLIATSIWLFGILAVFIAFIAVYHKDILELDADAHAGAITGPPCSRGPHITGLCRGVGNGADGSDLC